MNVGFKKFGCKEGDVAIIPLFQEKLQTPNAEVNSMVDYLKGKGIFKGAHGEISNFVRTVEGKTQDVIVIGLGKEEELTTEKVRRALGKAIKRAIELKNKKIFARAIDTDKLPKEDVIIAMVEGLGLGAYKFDRYKTDKKEQVEYEFSIACPSCEGTAADSYGKAVDEAAALVEGTILARDMVNIPANFLYPETLAVETVKVGKESGFEVEVLDETKIEELKMEAFLAVAKGSEKKPRFIVMRYFGDTENKDKRLGLVGKGLTFDTGGYSLKPSTSMDTMKSDMGGAAAVIGAMSVIAKRKLKLNVIAVVAACENAISGGAYKPGDIIGSMAGKTIEVVNTDAEGRLTLVDAVHYIIEKEHVDEVVDIATLTGAALVALGTTTTAVVTNNDEFYRELQIAAEASGERIWQLPSFEEYKKLIKSDIADLKNSGGRYAGTISAGLFIGEFVQNKPWLHLDIAGSSWADAAGDYDIKGGTGAGVRTIYHLVKNRV